MSWAITTTVLLILGTAVVSIMGFAEGHNYAEIWTRVLFYDGGAFAGCLAMKGRENGA